MPIAAQARSQPHRRCRERLELAGLQEVGTDFAETADQYVVIAVTA